MVRQDIIRELGEQARQVFGEGGEDSVLSLAAISETLLREIIPGTPMTEFEALFLKATWHNISVYQGILVEQEGY